MSPPEVILVAKLKDAYLNFERYHPEDIRSILSEAINALREQSNAMTIDLMTEADQENRNDR